MPSQDSETDDELVQVNVRVPKRDKEAADEQLPHGGLTREVRQRIREIAHGEPTTQEQELRRQLQALRDDRAELRAERDMLNEKLAQVDSKIERMERELTTLERERQV